MYAGSQISEPMLLLTAMNKKGLCDFSNHHLDDTKQDLFYNFFINLKCAQKNVNEFVRKQLFKGLHNIQTIMKTSHLWKCTINLSRKQIYIVQVWANRKII